MIREIRLCMALQKCRTDRILLGGDHPSQTTHQTVSPLQRVRTQIIKGPYLAGLEMDMEDFKKNRTKSIVFGWLTFLIPMGLGHLKSWGRQLLSQLLYQQSELLSGTPALQYQPENNGGEQGGESVYFAFYGREPECVTECINQCIMDFREQQE